MCPGQESLPYQWGDQKVIASLLTAATVSLINQVTCSAQSPPGRLPSLGNSLCPCGHLWGGAWPGPLASPAQCPASRPRQPSEPQAPSCSWETPERLSPLRPSRHTLQATTAPFPYSLCVLAQMSVFSHFCQAFYFDSQSSLHIQPSLPCFLRRIHHQHLCALLIRLLFCLPTGKNFVLSKVLCGH